jgi:hypothetical protein
MAERMIMEEVACLFVEQYEAMFHKDYKVSDVNLIRKTANRGIMDLYTEVATLFGDSIAQALKGAAFGAMDYIAYVDETWTPRDTADKTEMLDLERTHLESIEVILRMGEMHGNDVVEDIIDILLAARRHYHNLTLKMFLDEKHE